MLRTIERNFVRSSMQRTLVGLLGRVVRLLRRFAPLLAGSAS